jgi:hypothetical protein
MSESSKIKELVKQELLDVINTLTVKEKVIIHYREYLEGVVRDIDKS